MKILLLSGLLLLASAALPLPAAAEGIVAPPTDAACLQDLYRAFGREHRLSRTVLYGQQSPEEAELLSVFYDAEGNAWVKTQTNTWQSPAPGFEGTTWTDLQMGKQGEKDLLCTNNDPSLQASCVQVPRHGIFETRKTPTTDVVEPIVQSVRALQCRLRAVCELASDSPGKAAGALVTITLDGCMPMTFPVMEGCRTASPTIFTTLPGSCQAARRALVEREMDLLTLTVSYDASYRSLAQFAGIFQDFLVQFRFPLIEPLWQAVRMIGGLAGIPCFQSECNE